MLKLVAPPGAALGQQLTLRGRRAFVESQRKDPYVYRHTNTTQEQKAFSGSPLQPAKAKETQGRKFYFVSVVHTPLKERGWLVRCKRSTFRDLQSSRVAQRSLVHDGVASQLVPTVGLRRQLTEASSAGVLASLSLQPRQSVSQLKASAPT